MADVVTSGTGEHEQLADRAELRVSYAGGGGTRTAAVEHLGTRMRVVEPLLDLDGVQVRSRQLTVHAAWEGAHRSGHRAELRLDLRVDRLDLLDDLLSGLVAGEPDSLSGPHWRLADESAAMAAAQRRAVLEARRRAEAYAVALGARLGPLERVSDGGAERAGSVEAATMLAAPGGAAVAELGLEPLPVTVTATCTTTWTLLE